MQHEQRAAARVVRRVLEGRTLPAALADVAHAGDTGHPAFVRELASGALRHWGRLDALVRALATHAPAPPVAALLAVALYQLDHTRAPAFAVVDRAVEAAALLAHPGVKAFVNALLRRYLREREALNAAVAAASPVARWSYPRWWIGRVQSDHPTQWESILAVGNERPPLTLRVNRRVTTRTALSAIFEARGIEVTTVGRDGLIVAVPQPVADLPGFADGAFSVQDAGAQLAAPLLGAADGMRVLDACAAPGGKTTHLLELADVALVALDTDAARLARVGDNLARLRLDHRPVTLRTGDAGDPAAWWDGQAFDRILADVPCTASGIVRRHPDGKWLRRKTDVAGFALQQRRILDALWPLLAPGGVLLYATCSVFAQENEDTVRTFVGRHPDALRESINFGPDIAHDAGQLLPAGEGARHNQDGFFYARLSKAP
ncbi:MAG: 16S rRNA (cytosine(967)-C(5))-methyltransferase RsmB [Burkholderiales bacterium]|nr:16S rRNA (cytosine(967)-C(5))-methyltransferase RsmB [Burkholderiales bacterium]